jgi:eukaryotic-like serine/threonine-protein kinase
VQAAVAATELFRRPDAVLPQEDRAVPAVVPPRWSRASGGCGASPEAPRSGRSARPPPSPISRLLAELAHAPECDPDLPPRGRLAPGDLVGGYELVREIGRGGFGVVFEARDRERGRRVAVKTARPGADPEAACESLLHEIEAARLRHPNVITVLEGGRCEHGPFVVLEYLSGETLAQRMARGPLSIAEAIGIAVAVAGALAHAHARGVLHRDLKPANVFLPSAGEPKVIDFGLARVSGHGGPRGSGTSGYMSPEQQRGGPEDARTDLFALGVLLREMTTGGKAAPRNRPDERSRRHGDRVPREAKRLAAALLERDPAGRPASAREVLARLHGIRCRLETQATRRRRRTAPGFRPRAAWSHAAGNRGKSPERGAFARMSAC